MIFVSLCWRLQNVFMCRKDLLREKSIALTSQPLHKIYEMISVSAPYNVVCKDTSGWVVVLYKETLFTTKHRQSCAIANFKYNKVNGILN